MKNFIRKNWSIFIIFGYFVLLFACSFAYPIKGTALFPAKSDYKTAFQAAQGILVYWGYNITQSNPQTGLISGQRTTGTTEPTINTYNILITKNGNDRLEILISYNTSEVMMAAPPAIPRSDIVKIARQITKNLAITENDVLLEFGGKQKPLSSY